MKEYYRKPAETAATFTPDGWFRTGDAAMWLADGCLRFLGRYKDMLKVGGENVDPMETEGLLLEHPAVQQVAVVGLPDERLGEVAVAYVQRREGAAIDAEEVLGHCRGKVASFKLPRHVVFIDAFPMTRVGQDPQDRAARGREEAVRLSLFLPSEAGEVSPSLRRRRGHGPNVYISPSVRFADTSPRETWGGKLC